MPFDGLLETLRRMLPSEVAGNTISDIGMSATVFFAVFLVFRIFQAVLLRRMSRLAEKTKTEIDNLLVSIISKIRPQFYFLLSFYAGVRFLQVHNLILTVLESVLIVWAVYLVVASVQTLVNFVMTRGFGVTDEPGAEAAIGAMSKVIRGALWAVGALFILSNLGVNVTSAIAGLGIGGIAVALALQSVLGDLFSSFAIFLDKPFVVGDFIAVGEHLGTVEKIGIKTTRIRSLSGEEIIVSNKELTETRIRNLRRMQERRVSFSFGVVYGTPTETLKNIPKMVKEIIGKAKEARFSRAHFKEYGDFSLNFDVVYYVESRKYETYMNVQQTINLALYETFEREGISFAYPTQTLHLVNDKKQ